MRYKTDLEKIEYIGYINSRDNISSYQRKVAKRYVQELWDDASERYNGYVDLKVKEMVSTQVFVDIQYNFALFIKALELLNRKHKLLDTLTP